MEIFVIEFTLKMLAYYPKWDGCLMDAIQVYMNYSVNI